MITNLNSWSSDLFRRSIAKAEPSSNKSVESFDPSIPIPSDGPSAAEHASAAVACTFAQSALSVYPLFTSPFSSNSCSLVFIRGSFSRFPSMNFTFLTFHNPLKARVRTPSNVNQNLFFAASLPVSVRPLCLLPDVGISQSRFLPPQTHSVYKNTHSILPPLWWFKNARHSTYSTKFQFYRALSIMSVTPVTNVDFRLTIHVVYRYVLGTCMGYRSSRAHGLEVWACLGKRVR
jgi:hypothetical protein